jgi:signal transduction histidine kinase
LGLCPRSSEKSEVRFQVARRAQRGVAEDGVLLLSIRSSLVIIGTQLEYQELSAAALVAGALEQVAALAGDGQVALVTELAADLSLFAGDENKLSRTLVNLIANAIKFTPAGTVTISTSSDGQNLRFAVRDTGQGIPAEAFERIFEKFGQLDSHSKVGTGLGLAFCKLAVEAHGGQIQVESTPGMGSTFSFTIPRVARAVMAAIVQ